MRNTGDFCGQKRWRVDAEGVHLGFRQRELASVQHRRHQTMIPPGLGPVNLFQTLTSTPVGTAGTGPAVPPPGTEPVMPPPGTGTNPNPPPVQPVRYQPVLQQTVNPVQNPVYPQQPERFHTHVGHFNNPVDNIWAATNNLAQIPIDARNPLGVEAMKAIEILQTAVVQQLNYSNQDRLHSTPYNSRN